MWRLLGNVSAPALGAVEAGLSGFKPAPLPVVPPKGTPPQAATPLPQLDALLARLAERQGAWAAFSMRERAALLRSCVRTTLQVVRDAAQAAVDAKGSYGAGLGEEMLGWMPVLTGLREFADALEADGAPATGRVAARADGQLVVEVFPLGLQGVLYGGFKGEVWLQPGKPATQGTAVRESCAAAAADGGVSLVLGAGNQLPVVALDVLQKLVEGRCVVLKMNPINEYLGPFIRQAFAPLADAGYLELAYGGAEQGRFLVQHAAVADVHLTGSPETYDAIVWNGQPKSGSPPYPKPVTAELGCCTPYIVAPGSWSAQDMEFQAEQMLTGLLANAGHNCLKAELIITDAAWPQREEFLGVLRTKLDAAPQRAAYYPGSDRKFDAFRRKYPDAEERGQAPDSASAFPPSAPARPWLLRTGLAPEQADTRTENWCGVLQEVALPGTGGDPGRFLKAAVEYANTRCWGTLSCSLWCHPSTQREYADAFDDAIAALRYGSININCTAIPGFAFTPLTWGAFPGHTPQDIQSGNCFVHNTLLLDHPQKSVVHAPWRYHPYPPWSSYHRNMESLSPKLMNFAAYPSPLSLVPVVPAALLG